MQRVLLHKTLKANKTTDIFEESRKYFMEGFFRNSSTWKHRNYLRLTSKITGFSVWLTYSFQATY